MTGEKVVVTGGTGAVGRAMIRALVPAGYDVVSVSDRDGAIKAYRALRDGWEPSPEAVESVLRGHQTVNAFADLSPCAVEVPNKKMNLAAIKPWSENPFEGADVAILAAAGYDDTHSLGSTMHNYAIDRNSIDAAVGAGVGTIIYTSSVWRTLGMVGKGELIDAGRHEAPFTRPDSEDTNPDSYPMAKVRAVRYLREVAKSRPDAVFIWNDLGWYPRETWGAPPTNVDPEFLQVWIAERDLQLSIIRHVGIRQTDFAQDIRSGINAYGFTLVSQNMPPDHMQHPAFSYDLRANRRLGANPTNNVYDKLIGQDSSWRVIPVALA